MSVAEGFPGQRILVLPRPRVAEALDSPVTRLLTVTDVGFFPRAHHHGRERSQPIAEAVVMVCADGAGWCRTPSGKWPVCAGQVVVLPSGSPHSYGAHEDRPWTLWWLHVAGSAVPDLLAAAGISVASPVRVLRDPARAVSLIREVLLWTQRDETTVSMVAAAGAAWNLLALLASEPPPDSLRHDAIEAVAEHLRRDVTTRASVANHAHSVGLSPSHFAALFRQRMGVPVGRYQSQLRMAQARELLDTTDLPVGQVAARVGYDDPFYFSRHFRVINGITPVQYRSRDR